MRIAILACLMSMTLLPAAAEDAPATYRVEAFVVQVPKGTDLEIRTSGQDAFAPLLPEQAAPLVDKAITLRTKEGRAIEATAETISLSGKDFPKMLACPRVTVEAGAGKAASIFVGGKMEYLAAEKLPSGDILYRKKEDDPNGIQLSISVQPDEGRKTLVCDIGLSVTAVTGRQPVPGSSLPVGKPVLEKTALKSALHFPPGTPALLSAPVKNGGWILLFLRVSEPKAPAWKHVGEAPPAKGSTYIRQERKVEIPLPPVEKKIPPEQPEKKR